MKKVTIILTASYFLFSCNNNSKNEIQQAKQMAIDSMQQQAEIREAKQAVIDSMTLQANIQKAKQRSLDSIKTEKKNEHVASRIRSKPSAYRSNNDAIAEKSTTVVQSKKKKSKKIGRVAEGAIIGAGVGALSGAIISRNNKPGKGALIGGIIGAGVGAGTGAVIDKKQKQKGN